jgi:hypothetical protein
MNEEMSYVTDYLISAIAKILFLHNTKTNISAEDIQALERAFWDFLHILDENGIKLGN